MSVSWALQQAVFATLTVSSEVIAVLGNPPRIYDAVPRDAAFPYAAIGDGSEADWSTATEAGSEHTLAVHVWSRSGGHKECKEIAEAIRDALDGASLSVTGQTLIDIRYLDTDFARAADGETYRASLRFRAVTEPD
ncbi:MAG TPA: DUF3168 domain-containing protein [Rhizomicrobium sp.]|nr:DUF3168 domain-containing protein [Rhizomicrobium sp.]